MHCILAATLFLFSALAWAQMEPLPAQPEFPKDNPSTPQKIELGKKLFFDPRLSVDGTLSCNSCHNVMLGGDDNRPVSVGVRGQKGGRSSGTVWNSAYLSAMFWDGRAASLEEQAKGPLTNPIEMGMPSHGEVEARVKKIPGYVAEFKKVFGGAKDPITIDNIAKAIATYERTLVAGNSAFDKYMHGQKSALSADAKKGMELVAQTGCLACHSGANFAGPKLPAGTPFLQKFPMYSENNPYVEKYQLAKDLGRFENTKKEEDKHMWRVPTWRNIALTAPYMHNGMVPTLDEAVRVMAKSQLNKDLSDQDVKYIVAFLESLTGEFAKQTMPALPPTIASTVGSF